MKKGLTAAAFVWSLLVGSSFLAVSSPAQEPAADEAEHEGLRRLKTVFEEAADTNNMELLRPFVADGFSVVTFTDSSFDDFDTFKARWEASRKTMLGGGSYTVELVPDRSLLLGNGLALAKGNSRNLIVTGDGEEFRYSAHWTALCRKEGETWKILRVHCSLDPFGNPMVTAGFRKLAIKVGACVLVVGLLLGWLGRVIWARRAKPAAQ